MGSGTNLQTSNVDGRDASSALAPMLFTTLQLLPLWLVAGITFWSAFVFLRFRFAEPHARSAPAAGTIPDGASMPARSTADAL